MRPPRTSRGSASRRSASPSLPRLRRSTLSVDGRSQPQVERRLSPAGETEVNYFNNGVMTHETRIPGDSMFNTSGRGSGGGGVPQPCFDFSWFVTEPNPNAVVDPVDVSKWSMS